MYMYMWMCACDENHEDLKEARERRGGMWERENERSEHPDNNIFEDDVWRKHDILKFLHTQKIYHIISYHPQPRKGVVAMNVWSDGGVWGLLFHSVFFDTHGGSNSIDPTNQAGVDFTWTWTWMWIESESANQAGRPAGTHRLDLTWFDLTWLGSQASSITSKYIYQIWCRVTFGS